MKVKLADFLRTSQSLLLSKQRSDVRDGKDEQGLNLGFPS
jgi:hypothetical protein